MSVCLSTALYEKTYQHYIDNDKLGVWLKKLDYKFDEIIIFFNNISDEGFDKSCEYLGKFTDENISIYFSKDLTTQIVSKFKLSNNYANTNSYYYSVANYGQILMSKSEYLLYICEDISILYPSESFIGDSIKAIEENEDCISTGMNWSSPTIPSDKGSDQDAAEGEEYDTNPTHKNSLFYLTNGFSDHIYFTKRDKLLNIDYNTKHPFANRYPGYSGESFERKINSYQTINKMYRYIHKKLHYAHVGWWCYLKDLSPTEIPSKFEIK